MSKLNPLNWFKSKTEDAQPDEEVIPGKFLVIQTGFNDDGQIRVEVEYDDEFVDNLKKRGYIGTDNAAIVMKYVQDVYRSVAQDYNGTTEQYE